MATWTPPSSAEERKEIASAVQAAAILLDDQAALKGEIKDYADEMKNKFGLPAPMFNKMAKTLYEDTFEEKKSESEEFFENYEAIVKTED